MQSNELVDVAGGVMNSFNEGLREMKNDLEMNGWIFPTLEANMRNQINISSIIVEQDGFGYKMQSSIDKLNSRTSILGEVPLLISIGSVQDWIINKDKILKHCIEEIYKRDKRNVVILYDEHRSYFNDVGSVVKRIRNDKTIVEYPSLQGQIKDILDVKRFIEMDNHILVTSKRYFNGCEASNVILLHGSTSGVRNCLLRAVQNVICVQVGRNVKINGMKEENKFF